VTPQQLRAFVAVAQTSSFARASEQLHMSQPALSLSIRNLEQALGGRLLIRTTRQVRMTTEGALLLPQALQLLADWENVRERVRARFTLQRGHVTLAAMPSFAGNVLPAILRSYLDRHPNIEVTVQDVVHEQVVELVESARVELGFGFDPGPSRTLQFEPLFTDSFIAILPPASGAPAGRSITWKQLLRQPFITLQKPSAMRRLLEESLGAQGLALPVSLECHQLATVGQLVARGLGVSVVPSLCRPQMTTLGLRCLPVAQPAVRKAVGVITRRDHELSAAASAIVALLRARG
jgi:LysR family carnitine catabolism transcriptional activator